ncbi:hypothetical protein AVEN_148302-1 [Araneus ventricosus]|uniref:Uncharacterized protein n=1 Tax=Araneus ventricosus TaxID=182803 RepID=A0A4Y2WAC9_ARAVE|nr:hypothetical protein AVEN_133880-1 [Araneus ventricosus]GBO34603.1 hypothetical protein AVEN_148302-1 [Araneus ventricosus]
MSFIGSRIFEFLVRLIIQLWRADDELDELKRFSFLSFKEIVLSTGTLPLHLDVSIGHVRPYAPSSIRRTVFQTKHNLSHSRRKPIADGIGKRFIHRVFRNS